MACIEKERAMVGVPWLSCIWDRDEGKMNWVCKMHKLSVKNSAYMDKMI